MFPVTALVAGSSLLAGANAQSVFAHYMIGAVDASTDHAERDIQDAIAVGLDAFAMNVGDPTAGWTNDTVQQLFAAAEGTEFSLFFSFDMFQYSTLADHVSLFNAYRDHPNYFVTGADNLPVVSSYGGSGQPDDWASFKQSSEVYLIPNLDDGASGGGSTGPYYTDPAGELSEFNDIVDGYFSWESAWPASTGGPENISATGDQVVMEFAHNSGKDYMMGLSFLQFKDTSDGNWYRIGEVNFPERMTQILELKPEFTEVITWNDGGESHYISNLWEEAYTTVPEILEYANTDEWPHDGWQPLISSFITAFKAGKGADEMEPPGDEPIGAMWYRGMLKTCSENPPGNVESAIDSVNYAIVLPPASEGMSIRVSSGGNTLGETPAQPGLNYAAVAGMTTGEQKVELLDSSGSATLSATSGKDVTNDDHCNFNFNVVRLE
ncbi:hypothetical protein FQN54_006510 [Arachnomyces sp. PD_36]|nr:hypothetical protein FQN54_006510 [Arachnomyces sp. PD_36]